MFQRPPRGILFFHQPTLTTQSSALTITTGIPDQDSFSLSATKLNHALTPLLAGVVTFFLPCGFTQAMQIYTLSSGSFLAGGLTMLTFALGTLPVLALLGFSSLSIKNKAYAGVFYKTAGLIVIGLGLFNLLNSLVVFGLIPALFNF